MENANPLIKQVIEPIKDITFDSNKKLENVTIDNVFELIRNILDPEHPYTLEQLNVVCKDHIEIGEIAENDILCKLGLPIKFINVTFVPTVPHCSMAGLIGLCLKAQLEKYIEKYWIRVYIKEGTHVNYTLLNKQFNDKDRVMAALENEAIIETLLSQLPKIN